ncbi:hypothetical protein MLD38_012049 [Melastoma candidum]|uniref:Uncharacterized protein n=1 Tax=Melastoma candidum TaxID=119954 RepID=A0ACB9R8M6_9MYRT|nr:hypothetical protein MLD38_012049 [Melastoma candidum]
MIASGLILDCDITQNLENFKQEPHKMVTVGEYRLPEPKPNTLMYFNFPRNVQTNRVVFGLLGDVTAFNDGPQ